VAHLCHMTETGAQMDSVCNITKWMQPEKGRARSLNTPMKILRRPKPFSLLTLLPVLLAASCIGGAVPREEHPRPDLFRPNWVTLNGQWQFQMDEQGDGDARGLSSGHELGSTITVPFCPESKLSGIGHYGFMKHTWYRRMFDVPAAMQGKRVRLHFGAVDYKARVWVNGRLAGAHTGGSVPFDFDVTPLLRAGENELVVNAFHDVAGGQEPTGKQTHSVSEGCVYTRTTGIWQPVWLEAVGSSFVENFSLTPDPDHSRVLIDAKINGAEAGLTLTAEALADGQSVGSDSCAATGGEHYLVLNLSEKRLWEPGAPFLYDLKFTISRGAEKIDEMASYFGLRTVSIQGRSILINGKRVFQRLILDQGFYPDGEWTAPSDEELKKDIERSMAAGYNGARLHQKVFEPRYLYWADKLGYLVWGEFPNWGFDYHPADYSNFINEWNEVLLRDRNHPAIIGWCPFNETSAPQAGELQQIIWRQTTALDPSRPIIESSGYAHTVPNPLVLDDHDYNQNPEAFQQRWEQFFGSASTQRVPERYAVADAARADRGVPFMVSEFGGIGWATAGGWGYGDGPKSLDAFYQRYEGLVTALLDNPNLFGFCYTQLTDVEQEHNGLYYYDRRPKFDLKRLHDFTARPAAYETSGPTAGDHPVATEHQWQVLVGAAADGELAKPYRFTTTAPAADWTSAEADDSGWASGLAPFGHALPGVRTAWTSDDIWLRQNFASGTAAIQAASLVIFHDEYTEVYVNGQLIWKRGGYTTAYEAFGVKDALQKAMRKGRNILAVHTHQTVGGQFIDLALLVELQATKTAELRGN
jgi:hypothetical protein